MQTQKEIQKQAKLTIRRRLNSIIPSSTESIGPLNNHSSGIILLDREPNRALKQFEDNYAPKYSQKHQRMKTYVFNLKEKSRVIQNVDFLKEYCSQNNTSFDEGSELVLIKPSQVPGKNQVIKKFKVLQNPYQEAVESERRNKAASKIQRAYRAHKEFIRSKYEVLKISDVQKEIDQVHQKIFQRFALHSLANEIDAVIRIQAFIRKYQAHQRFQTLIFNARKIVRFIKCIEKIKDIHQKCQFFFKYEKIFEKQIRNSKVERILKYQKLIKNLNDTRNTDLQMSYLRRYRSQGVLIPQEHPNEDQERMQEIQDLVQTKKKKAKIVEVQFQPQFYLAQKRRNSNPQTKIEKFNKRFELNFDYFYQKPKSQSKRQFKKRLMTKQKLELNQEYNTLLKKEIDEFKKKLNWKPKPQKSRTLDFSSRTRRRHKRQSEMGSTHMRNLIDTAHKRLTMNDGIEPLPISLKRRLTTFQGQESFVSPGRLLTILPKPLKLSEKESEDDDSFAISISELGHENLNQTNFKSHVHCENHIHSKECCQQIKKEGKQGRHSSLENRHTYDPWLNLKKRMKNRQKMLRIRHMAVLHGINAKDGANGKIRDDVQLNEERLKEVRRRQFFNFFADFYDKYEDGTIGHGQNFTFTDQEKEANLKRYFKTFYRDDLLLPTEIKEIPLFCDEGSKKRGCKCHEKYQEDLKNGKAPERIPKSIMVEMLVEPQNKDQRKEDYLGRSQGIQQIMNVNDQKQDLMDLIEERLAHPKKSPTRENDYQITNQNTLVKDFLPQTSIANRIRQLRLKGNNNIRFKSPGIAKHRDYDTSTFEQALPEYHDLISKYSSSSRNMLQSRGGFSIRPTSSNVVGEYNNSSNTLMGAIRKSNMANHQMNLIDTLIINRITNRSFTHSRVSTRKEHTSDEGNSSLASKR